MSLEFCGRQHISNMLWLLKSYPNLAAGQQIAYAVSNILKVRQWLITKELFCFLIRVYDSSSCVYWSFYYCFSSSDRGPDWQTCVMLLARVLSVPCFGAGWWLEPLRTQKSLCESHHLFLFQCSFECMSEYWAGAIKKKQQKHYLHEAISQMFHPRSDTIWLDSLGLSLILFSQKPPYSNSQSRGLLPQLFVVLVVTLEIRRKENMVKQWRYIFRSNVSFTGTVVSYVIEFMAFTSCRSEMSSLWIFGNPQSLGSRTSDFRKSSYVSSGIDDTEYLIKS